MNNTIVLKERVKTIDTELENIERRKRELIATKYNILTEIANIKKKHNATTWIYSWFY